MKNTKSFSLQISLAYIVYTVHIIGMHDEFFIFSFQVNFIFQFFSLIHIRYPRPSTAQIIITGGNIHKCMYVLQNIGKEMLVNG